MAIAGWLMIGVALLVLVAVMNNSWQPLIDQFRQRVGGAAANQSYNPSGGGGTGIGGGIGSTPLGPATGTAGQSGGTAAPASGSGGTTQAPGGGAPTA